MRNRAPRIRGALFNTGMLVLLAVLSVAFPQAVPAAVILQDDFEPSATVVSPSWSGVVLDNKLASPIGSYRRTPSEGAAGTSASFQANWAANSTLAIYLRKPGLSLNEIYARFYVKWSPGFQFTPGTTRAKKIFRTFGPTTLDDLTLMVLPQNAIDPTPGAYKFRLYSQAGNLFGGQFNFDENLGVKTTVQTGQWYCLEFHIKKNDAPEEKFGGVIPDGIFEGWIDGVKKWEYFSVYMGDPLGITSVNVGGNLSPDPPTQDQTEWFDEIILAGAPLLSNPSGPYIGCQNKKQF